MKIKDKTPLSDIKVGSFLIVTTWWATQFQVVVDEITEEIADPFTGETLRFWCMDNDGEDYEILPSQIDCILD